MDRCYLIERFSHDQLRRHNIDGKHEKRDNMRLLARTDTGNGEEGVMVLWGLEKRGNEV